MSAQELSTYAGILLSLLFSYVPWLNTWYAGLEAGAKRLVMLIALAVVAFACFGLACIPALADTVPGVACDQTGAVGLFKAFISAVIANQATYLISVKTTAVKKVLLRG